MRPSYKIGDYERSVFETAKLEADLQAEQVILEASRNNYKSTIENFNKSDDRVPRIIGCYNMLTNFEIAADAAKEAALKLQRQSEKVEFMTFEVEKLRQRDGHLLELKIAFDKYFGIE
jgi:hypothetical protein